MGTPTKPKAKPIANKPSRSKGASSKINPAKPTTAKNAVGTKNIEIKKAVISRHP